MQSYAQVKTIKTASLAWFPFLAAVLLLLVGLVMKGPPADPDVLFTVSQNLGTMLVFFAVWICILSWGYFLGHLLGITKISNLGFFAISIGLGTAAFSILGSFFGLVGLVGYSMAPLHESILLLGTVFFGNLIHKKPTQIELRLPKWDFVFLIAGSFFLVTLLFLTFRGGFIHGTTDPYLYSLLGPRVWSENGSYYYHYGWHVIFAASSWENLFFFGNSILGNPKGLGIIEGQLFGQWTEILLGFVGAIAAFDAFLKNWFREPGVRLLAVIVAVSNMELFLWTCLAKNDWGIVSWCFLALAILFNFEEQSLYSKATAGVLLGLAISGKCTTVISLVPILFVWVGIQFMRLRPFKFAVGEVLTLGFWTLVGSAPIYFRNILFTGNPFFPVLVGLFGARFLSESTINGEAKYMAHHFFSFPEFFGRLIQHMSVDWLSFGVFLMPFLALVLNKRSSYLYLVIASFISLLGFEYFNWMNSFIRWIAPSLMILSAYGTISVFELANKVSQRFFPYLRVVIALAVLFYVRDDIAGNFHNLENYFEGASPTIVLRQYKIIQGADSRAWLRLNAKADDLIVTTGDFEYYLNYYQRIYSMQHYPEIDDLTCDLLDTDRALHALKQTKARYILDVAHWSDRYYSKADLIINRLTMENPQAIVYIGPDSWVMDMEKIEEPKMTSSLDSSFSLPGF